jgi:predicted enzyme related to lactoylglutathione lyase
MVPTEPGAINGAITERKGEIKAPIIVITVASIDESLNKVAEAGGKVVEGKQTVENMGHYAYVADPDGNVISLWENIAR